MKMQIKSTDIDFLLALIDWLNDYPNVEPNTTVVRLLEDEIEV